MTRYLPIAPLNSRLFFLIFFCTTSFLRAQQYDAIVDDLLTNDRISALKKIAKVKKHEDVTSYLLERIIRMENGELDQGNTVAKEVLSYDRGEAFLFAHWDHPYIFGDYVDIGYDALNLAQADPINLSEISNSTLRSALSYYKGIVSRHLKKDKEKQAYFKRINAIKDWEFCGVFENLNNSGISTSYEPELNVSSNVLFDARGNGEVQWYIPRRDEEPYKYFVNHIEYGTGVNYAQTFFESDESKRVNLRVGAGGLLRVWVNDVLVADVDKDYVEEMDAHNYEVQLQKGNNRILVKSATNAQTAYFIVRLEDDAGKPVSGLTFDLSNKSYKKGTQETVAPEAMAHPLIKDLKAFENAVVPFVVDYSLATAHIRNADYEAAIEIYNMWLEKYPKSSLLLSHLANCRQLMSENTVSEKILENLTVNDPDYYQSALREVEDFDTLLKLDLEEFERKLDKISSATNYTYVEELMQVIKYLRLKDMTALRKRVDVLVKNPMLPSRLKSTIAEFYSQIYNDDDATIAVLEEYTKDRNSYSDAVLLSSYYSKINDKDAALGVYEDLLKQYPESNDVRYRYVNNLHAYSKYKESLPIIEGALKNYPDSFKFLQFMGTALQQLDKKEEALVYYERALEKRSSNGTLRESIRDLKNEKDPLEQFKVADLYKYIGANRKRVSTNNYGINVILSQTNILKYPKSGGRYNATFIYEVTSQKGIDDLKEYNLGLYGDYTIHKSEIVKPDGSIVPADKSGSNLVFNGLSEGDVILIDYDKSFSSGGRFYKDYVDTYNFRGYHPIQKGTQRLITPENYDINITSVNGEIDFKTYKKDGYSVREWSVENLEPLPQYENLMPVFEDVATYVHLSTIGDWDDIATWYSDLVRSQVIFDNTVQEAFNSIFPDGYTQLSEDERARRIYDYITSSFSYSYVNFKQSGFVPQKPSKTITTKLGDCKDFSTLYLTLAQKAELEANLVLILTSDNGARALVLPSTDFNHCIVNVNIDGKSQYLELTNKYLPYKTIPPSLIKASALEIPYTENQNVKSGLYTIPSSISRKPAVFTSRAAVAIGDNFSEIDLTTETTGNLSAYYIELFSENEGEVLEKSVLDDVRSRNANDFSIVDVSKCNRSKNSDKVSFTSTLKWNEKTSKIGSLKTFRVPYFTNPYTQGAISLESRKYPVNYIGYENADSYKEQITITVPEGQEITEIPENKSYTFKDHAYSVSYERKGNDTLLVSVEAVVSFNDIAPASYPEFRTYVQNVLETRRQLVGYK